MNKTRNITYYLAAAIALATFILYLTALQNDFVEWDDGPYVFENPHLRSFNMAFFKWAFTDYSISYWHPLTWISHALDYAVWGLNPLGHHLTNIILHSVNTFAVVFLIVQLFQVFREKTSQEKPSSLPGEQSVLIAAGVAGLLFGIHPLHVESVAWVAERKDLLCALFYLLSVIMYVKYAGNRQSAVDGQQWKGGSQESGVRSQKSEVGNQQSARLYLLTLGFFVLALLSKPMAVTLPVVLLIVDWYPFERIRSFASFRKALIEKIPFFALSLSLSIVTMVAQKTVGAIRSAEFAPLSMRLPVAAQSLVVYLGKMIWPLNLIPHYPYAQDVSLFSLEYLVPIVLVIGLTAAFLVAARKRKAWLAAWGYYVVTLVPVLGIVQAGGQAMADRYTYLPSLGPFFMAGIGAAWIWSTVTALTRRRQLIKALTMAASLFVLVALSYLTVTQIGIWRNSIVLWSYVIQKEPDILAFAYNNRGNAFVKRGLYNEAIADFGKAIALDPSFAFAYNNRGMLLGKMGGLDDALQDLNAAIRLDPSYYQAYYNRAVTFENMGRLENAIEDFKRVIALHPSAREAYLHLGFLLSKISLPERAIEAFSEFIALDPNYAEAYSNRGVLYTQTNQPGRALEDFNRAIGLSPNFAMVYINRGMLYSKSGQKDLAREDYQKACALGVEIGCHDLQELMQGR